MTIIQRCGCIVREAMIGKFGMECTSWEIPADGVRRHGSKGRCFSVVPRVEEVGTRIVVAKFESKDSLACLRKHKRARHVTSTTPGPTHIPDSSANLSGLVLGMHRSYVRAAQSISSHPLNLHQASATIYPPLP